MKVLLISGSLRSASYNSAIIAHLAKQLQDKEGVEAEVFEGLDKLPIFSPDLDKHDLDVDDSPQVVRSFRKNVALADCVVIATPEYAFEIPGGLKNALDWLVSSGELVDKPVGIITASTSSMGGESANEVLTKLAGILSAKVEARLCVARVNKKVDENGKIIDTQLLQEQQNFLKELL